LKSSRFVWVGSKRVFFIVNFMQLVYKRLERVYFVEDFFLGSARPGFSFRPEFFKAVAEETGFLFVEIEAFSVVFFVDLVEDQIEIGLDIIDHFINLPHSLRDFTILDFAYLNNTYTGFFNGLNVTVSDLFNVGDQLRIIFIESLLLGVESLANLMELRGLLMIL
jgi:hypothetical protein